MVVKGWLVAEHVKGPLIHEESDGIGRECSGKTGSNALVQAADTLSLDGLPHAVQKAAIARVGLAVRLDKCFCKIDRIAW